MDKVRTQALFENLLQSVAGRPTFLGSARRVPDLGDFIGDLDPGSHRLERGVVSGLLRFASMFSYRLVSRMTAGSVR